MPGLQQGPLAGVKVMELSHVMAGPVCGMMLADMGADVIKIERPGSGDSTRDDDQYTVAGQSASFLMVNRNKRGIAIDLKSESGRKVLARLLEDADVFLENHRPGAMERLGFGYEQIRERYPRLVYCSVSGFGLTGPYRDRPGFDLIAQGMSGIMSYTGEGPGRPPVKCGAPITDIVAGILAAMGIAAAIHNRTNTGKGQKVESSLFEAGVTLSYWQSAIALANGGTPGPMGSAHPLSAPYQAFEASDGWLTLGAANQSNWLRLLEALAAPELGEDPRFGTNTARMTNRRELEEALNEIFRARPQAEWLERLAAAGVPAGPILDISEVHRDPQVLAREMVVEVPHTIAGTVKTVGLPVKFSETAGGPKGGAPLLGEHTREVLSECGFSGKQIDALLEEGAIAEAE